MTLIRCILPMTPPLHSFSGSLLPSGTLWSPWRLWETWATLMQFGADKAWEKRTFSKIPNSTKLITQGNSPNHNYWTWSIQRQSWIFRRYWRLSWWDGSLTKIHFLGIYRSANNCGIGFSFTANNDVFFVTEFVLAHGLEAWTWTIKISHPNDTSNRSL